MRTKMIKMLIAVTLGVMIPALLVLLLQDKSNFDNEDDVSGTTIGAPNVVSNEIAVLFDNNIIQMPVESYVLSVVLSEMPVDFEIEALKAQAVVARTYALRRSEGNSKHPGAAVCNKSSCCQGFCSIDDYLQNGGEQSSIAKASEAVEETKGEVLTYNGKLIDATYFSCSGGLTEDAQAVWGTEVPYLQSVESPGEEQAKHYVDTVKYDIREFTALLDLPYKSPGDVKIDKTVYTKGGGIKEMEIGGKSFSGPQLRKALKLRSTSFYISIVGETVIITTKGFGHRVGMSQYGADAMAVNGATYAQILLHYYQGVELIHYDFD